MSTTTTSTKTPLAPFTVRRITDTRDYIEDGDRWIPVPGTGSARPCDRCGSTHEIHAEVADTNGGIWNVGVGCATTDKTEARSLSGKATRHASKQARQAAGMKALNKIARIRRSVTTEPFPAGAITRTPTAIPGAEWLTCGLGRVLVQPWADEAERMACLEDDHRHKRAIKIAGGPDEWNRLQRLSGLV